ncbi:proteoglycan 4-like isoform X2 [Diachasmimorpha longicaudata]|uniref:proteoglycan 4-like isoform X2 n=1 Tax=Diachasmimorpha longicaudata TaxID=58733 RepID=UPI0030B89A4D
MSRSTRLRSRYRIAEPPPEAENPSSKSRKGIGNKRVGDKPETRKNTRGTRTKSTSTPDAQSSKKTIVKKSAKPSPGVKKHIPPVPSRSSKNLGVQVTEKEPDNEKSKIPTTIRRTVSKDPPKSIKPLNRRESPRTTKLPLRTRSKGPVDSGDLPKTKLKTSAAPKSPSKLSEPEKIERKSKRLTKSSTKSPQKSGKIERKSKRLTKSSIKSPQKSEKKFFKHKRNIGSHSKVSPMKRGLRQGLLRPTRPLRKKTSPLPVRQLTLSESFAKMKKTLRPRRTGKDYNEETVIESKKPTPGGDDHPKTPVYKTLNTVEKPKDKEKVYEFSFDANDSNERLQKKRKKRTVRKEPAKRPRKATKEVDKNSGVQHSGKQIVAGESGDNSKKTTGKIPAAKDDIEEAVEAGEVLKETSKPSSDHQNTTDHNQIPEDAPPSPSSLSSQGNSPFADHFEVSADVHVPPDAPVSTPGLSKIPTSTPQTPVIHSIKPKMISNEKLEGERRITLSSTPLHPPSDSMGPTSAFTNRPCTQFKTMLNHSLIRRSFSPIVKQTSEKVDTNFDSSSPWRPISLSTFSRVKNVFQSTPQGKKVLTPHGINSLMTEHKRSLGKINRIVEENDSSVVESPKKSPRKFGTVLGNISSPGSASPRMSDGSSVQDKENQMSPRKSPSKRVRAPLGSSSRPLEKDKRTEGPPGGLKEQEIQRDERILRQSNLHNFLGIPEMPSSTGINTAHGIFDDGDGIVPGKSIKASEQHFSIGNAFGFEEDSHAGQNESSRTSSGTDGAEEIQKNVNFDEKIQKDKAKEQVRRKIDVENVQKKILEKRPMRLPTRPVQKAIVDDVSKEKKEEKGKADVSSGDVSEDEDTRSAASIKSHEATKQDVVEAGQFLDTFDADERNASPLEVPLFVDPEPVHFKQPPRYSYTKRKRDIHHNTSDETDDVHSEDEDEILPKRKIKKRKTKAEKEQRKQLDEWAKSVNQTFDEIEHFDLLVE